MMDPQGGIAKHQQGRRARGAPGGEPEAVRVWLLGSFRVSVGSRSIEEEGWRLKKAASLIKVLALAEGHRMHREQAIELLWPTLDPEAAANNLHQVLHVARQVLDPSAPASGAATSRYLQLRDERLDLCPDGPLWVDVEAFEEAAATARHALVEPAAYRVAIDLYSGELLPRDRYEPWAEERRAELREAYLSLLVELAGLYEERGELGEATEAFRRVVAEEPTHEGAHVGLMRLYALSGRRREALRQYERLRETLFRELRSEPEEAAVRLHDEIWAGAFPPADSSVGAVAQPEEERPFPAGAAGRHNLPLARTSFVGREREVLEVKRLSAMTRLLTLTGAAGCGKTRLALKAARDLAPAYPDGAWLVELAPLSEEELVPQAVAGALGVREQPGRSLVETLVDVLGARRMLLVLDNCEHLIGAVVSLVDELLGSCPGLRVLATSRESLNAAGEVNWVVPSLTVPDARRPSTPQELEAYESVRLFVERARQRDPSFALTPRNGQAVADVCRRLDGIPLAIEFATARVGVLSSEQIASKLDDALGFLTAGGRSAVPRHQTLRATLEWSHELLSEPERGLFRRLSVFAGGFTLEAAEKVGADEEGIGAQDVLDLLGRLVHKSLVVAEEEAGEEDELRYRMLEFVRQYGRERLEESGEADAVRGRHAAWFLDLAERADSELRGPRQVVWLKRLSKEQDNLRAAMTWLLGRSAFEEAVRLGWALWLFWWMHGHFAEGRRWMEEALAKGDAMPASSRVRALFVAGTMADGQADRRSAEPLLEESLSLARKLGDKVGTAAALGSGGLVAAGQGQHERSIALLQESADLWLEVGDRWYASMVLNFLAVACFGQGDHERAKRLAEQGLALARELGDAESAYVACHTGAMLAQAEGEHERARGLLREGLELAWEAGEETNAAYCLEELAALAAAEGRVARAARLWGAAEALLEKIEAAAYIYAPDRSVYQGRVSAARAQLDEAAFDAAWAEGRAMTAERAIAYALLEEEERELPTPVAVSEQQRPPAGEPAGRLTRRELEVALLVGRGMTNRQIALELSVSEHTVANHMRKILKKLDLRSRAHIVARMAQQQWSILATFLVPLLDFS